MLCSIEKGAGSREKLAAYGARYGVQVGEQRQLDSRDSCHASRKYTYRIKCHGLFNLYVYFLLAWRCFTSSELLCRRD